MSSVSERHQAVVYQRLVRSLGFPSGPLVPRLVVSESAKRSGEALLTAAGWDRRSDLVALAPGAAYGGAKRWPAASFAAVATTLSAEGFTPFVVGGPGDRRAAIEVVAALPPHVRLLDLVGRTDLPALGGVLAATRGLISNDSGAMHFAAAVGVPVTAIFGPTDERATHPLGERTVVLTHDVWCRPCMMRECPLAHRCMRGVHPDAVLAATRNSW
jgi:heptosyltransferase-2